MQNIYNLGSAEGGEDQIERSASVGDACVGPACVLGQESRRLNWGTPGDSGIKVRMCTLAPAARLKLEYRGGEEGGGDPLRSWGKMSEREGLGWSTGGPLLSGTGLHAVRMWWLPAWGLPVCWGEESRRESWGKQGAWGIKVSIWAASATYNTPQLPPMMNP